MGEERQDPKQVAAFRAMARRIADTQSEQKFEEALRRLMTPSPDQGSDSIEASSDEHERTSKA
jgi:hypothetical protein